MIREIEEFVQRSRENKYAYEVGLKAVDFEVDEDRLEALDTEFLRDLTFGQKIGQRIGKTARSLYIE